MRSVQMKHLAVKNFREFQHYKDRNPPWIKLHRSILTDPAFLFLSEVAQAQLMKLWVLASQAGNPLPDDEKFLARSIGTKRLRLEEIVGAGFLIPVENASATLAAPTPVASKRASTPLAHDASNPLADHHARASARSREGEAEGE